VVFLLTEAISGLFLKLQILAPWHIIKFNATTNGKPAIREDYKKEQQLSQLLDKNKGKDKSKNQEQENELAL